MELTSLLKEDAMDDVFSIEKLFTINHSMRVPLE